MERKLIAVAVCLVATLAHSATANWCVSAANIYAGSGSESAKVAVGTTVYMFDAGLISQSLLFDVFANDTSSDLTKATGYAASIKTTGPGAIAATIVDSNFSYGETSTSGDTKTYNFFFAITDGDKIYLSDSIQKDANKTESPITLGYASQTTSPYDSKALPTDGFVSVGHWSQVSGGEAPEPTTCSLLLVGLAGMGLKRLRKCGKKSA